MTVLDYTRRVLIGLAGCVVAAFLAAWVYAAGLEDGARAVRHEAVKTGVARYRVSQITGEAHFEWVTPEPRAAR